MQGAHHFTCGIELGGEIVHAEERHRGQQTDLTRAVNMGVLLLLNWREAEGNIYNDDQQTNRQQHSLT